MVCQKFCCFQKARLTGDPDCWATALEIFLAAHRLLTNFMGFFKFFAGKCCCINYDDVPLHGALDIVAVAMASIICGNIPNKESQRPGLFQTCICIPCRDTQVLPEDFIRKVDRMLSFLRGSCAIENIVRQIKCVLSTLEALPTCARSEKHRMLSLLLKQIMRRLICYGHGLGEPLGNTQTRLALNLVNNFIRDWSEKRSAGRPSLRFCRFCDRVISETTRQWGTFCCKDAQVFSSARKEWALRQSISDTLEDKPCDWRIKLSCPGIERRTFIDKISRACASAEKLQTDGLGHLGTKGATIRRALSASFPRRTSREGDDVPVSERDRLDEVVDGDSRKARGEMKRSRDIDRSDEHPYAPVGRGKRGDASYRREPEKIRGSRGLRDTDEEGTAVVRGGRIKTDKRRAGLADTESEGRKADRSRDRKGSASEATAKSATKDGGRKKLYRNALSESGGDKRGEKTADTDNEEKTTDRRRRKRARKDGVAGEGEIADESEGGRTRGRRKKRADAFGSERKGMSHSGDEEGIIRKRDGKRKGRSSAGDEADSDFERRRGGGRYTW